MRNNNNKTQQSSEMQNRNKTHETKEKKTNENEFKMRIIRMQNGIVCHKVVKKSDSSEKDEENEKKNENRFEVNHTQSINV